MILKIIFFFDILLLMKEKIEVTKTILFFNLLDIILGRTQKDFFYKILFLARPKRFNV